MEAEVVEDVNCEFCGKRTTFTRRQVLRKSPPLLCLSLQRFVFDPEVRSCELDGLTSRHTNSEILIDSLVETGCTQFPCWEFSCKLPHMSVVVMVYTGTHLAECVLTS